MTFRKLQKLAAERHGLVVAQFNGGSHWQIRGGAFVVNYYPTKGTCFVNGMAKGFKCRPAQALEVALHGPPSIGRRAERRKHYRQERDRLFARSRICHWCKTPFTRETATLDHKIALGMGGADQRDNYVLACESCNKSRGCSALPPPHLNPKETQR